MPVKSAKHRNIFIVLTLLIIPIFTWNYASYGHSDIETDDNKQKTPEITKVTNWTAAAGLLQSDEGPNLNLVVLKVYDETDTPLAAASVTVMGNQEGISEPAFMVKLPELEEGYYAAFVEFPETGEWEFRFMVMTESHYFQHMETMNILDDTSSLQNGSNERTEQFLTNEVEFSDTKIGNFTQWNIELSLLAHNNTNLHKIVALKVTDVNGSPVELSEATIIIKSPSAGYEETTKLTLEQLEPGYYAAPMEFSEAGNYSFYLNANRQGAQGAFELETMLFKPTITGN